MRTNSLTFLTAATLLSTSALSTEALAQKGMSLQPQSSWAVKNVNAADENGYCAMAQRFNEGTILTIAKNNSGEMSLALDFASSNFDRAQSYPVVLDAGAGQQRSLNAKPITSKAFVFKIGNDNQFFSALDKTGYLRVELNNENYNFNLADIDAGRQKLDSCLVTSISPAAGDEGSGMVPMPAHAAESVREKSDALEQEKNLLSARLFKLESENEKLRLELAKSSAQPARAQPVAGHSSGDAPLKKELEILKAEKIQLENLLAMANKDIKQKSNISIVKLSQENQRLQSLLDQKADSSKNPEEIMQLKRRVSELEDANLKLSNSLKNKPSEISAALSGDVAALKAENANLQKQISMQDDKSGDLKALKDDIENLEKNNEALSARLVALMREKDDALAQIDFYETENDSLKAKVSSIESSPANSPDVALLDQLRNEIGKIELRNAEGLAQKDAEIAMLETQIRSLNKQVNASAENDSEAAETYKTQLEALTIQNELLKGEMIALSNDKTSIDQMRADLKLAIQDKEKISQDFESLKMRAATLEAESLADQDLVRELEAKKTEISALQKDVLKHQIQNSDLRGSLKSSENSAPSAKAVQAEIETLKAQNEKLRQTIVSSVSNEKAMEQKLSGLVSENKILNEKLSSSESVVAELGVLKQALIQLESENKALEQNIAQNEKNDPAVIAELSRNLDLLRKENESLQLSLSAAKEEKRDVQISVAESLKISEQTIAELGNSVERLKTENVALRKSANDLVAEKEQLMLALDDFKSRDQKNSLAASHIKDLMVKMEKLEQDNTNLKNAVETASNFNEELQASMQSAMENTNKESNDYIAASREEIKILEKKLAQSAAQLEAINAEKLALTENVQKQGDDLGIAEEKKALGNMQAKLEKLERLNESLEMELASLKQDSAHNARDFVDMSGNEVAASKKQDEQLAAAPMKDDIASEAVKKLNKSDALIPERARTVVEKAQARHNDIIAKQESAEVLAAVEPAAGEQKLVPASEVSQVPEPAKLGEDLSGLSEAQRFEQNLKRDLMNKAPQEVTAVKSGLKQDVAISKHQEIQGGVKQPENKIAEVIANKGGTSEEIAAILQKADIAITQNIKAFENTSEISGRAYQWKSAQNLFGSAYLTPALGDDNFDRNVKVYLERTESRCKGDFAIVPESSYGSGSTRVDSYEIACIGNGVDSSAAVAFFVHGGDFMALAHEAPSSNMGHAMEARDRIVEAVGS